MLLKEDDDRFFLDKAITGFRARQMFKATINERILSTANT